MRTLAVVLLLLSPVPPLFGQTTDSKSVPKQPTPTVFQADEGDRWMLLGVKPLIFISIEDELVFPLAARLLSSTEKAAIADEMAARRKVRLVASI
ncbi:MAG: hypothetical protein ABR881_25190 [Candidatus Sulfotelmatobacter sp.]|jgi:hypothetical protein